MLFCSIKIYLIFFNIIIINAQINMTAYRQMPPLNHFEDYDACLKYNNKNNKQSSLKSNGTYCIIYAEIVPNPNSTLWQQIELISNDTRKRHFRHDHLFFGVCLERCESILAPLSLYRRKELYVGKVLETEILDFNMDVHKRSTDERIRYEQLIGSCLNYEFQAKYELKLHTSLEYCESADVELENETLDLAVYALFVLIVILNIISTFIDYRLKLQQPLEIRRKNRFYKILQENKMHRILTSFSICRNYYRLTEPAHSEIAKDLRFFDMLRAIGVFLVIFGHTLMLFMATPLANTEFFELFFHRTETAIIENGAGIIQIFFVMSGFLLYTKFTQKVSITKDTSVKNCMVVYFKVFAYRYFRIVPSLIILLLFNASVLVRLQDGPFWRHLIEVERTFCRELWWKHILFINNFLFKKSCCQQTWYLAADMQLFEFYLILLIIVAKFRRLKRAFVCILLLLAIAIPVTLTYYLQLEAIYHSNPENYRYMFFKNAETLYQAYTPSYANLGGYLFGILSAHYYLKRRSSSRENYFRGKWRFELAWRSLFPIGFALTLLGAYVMSLEVAKPNIWIALFAGVYRNAWVLICAVAVLGLSFKVGGFVYEMSGLSVFRLLGRISYQAFLWHVVLIRLLGGYQRQPIHINRFYLTSMCALAFLFTNLVAFIMAILVEFPIAEVVKCLLKTT